MRNKYLMAAAAAALSTALATSAHALTVVSTYTTQLEYKDVGGSTPMRFGTDTVGDGEFGLVTLTDYDNGTVGVNVALASGYRFLNTGGPHDPFLFNMDGNYTVTLDPNQPGQSFFNVGYDTNGALAPNFEATPFGQFTNKIGCCSTYHPAVPEIFHPAVYNSRGRLIQAAYTSPAVPAYYDENNGASNASLPPINFTVSNGAAGVTFLGVNPGLDADGRFDGTYGTGAHFTSNGGGWWFTADVVSPTGATFNVAARDTFGEPLCVRNPTNAACGGGAVPEPGAWALMIVGFGAVGYAIRRRRYAIA
jgi:hypothetical protein